ncbi:MAG TPA: VOC family protein [Thermodesulfobacteriota bacterium]
MKSINPYLGFNGNCEEAFTFYKSVFGGEFSGMQRFREVTDEESKKVLKPEEGEKIMHVALPMGKGNFLMGSDSPEALGETKFGNHISISVHADNKEEADRLFAGLSVGGQVTMPMADMFWGDYFGMCTDKFGFQWMVNYSQTPQK